MTARVASTHYSSEIGSTEEQKTYRIATIPGDGIGKEVVPAGQQVLEALASTSKTFRFEFENFDWGGDYYRKHGMMMPEDGLDAIRDKDAILFGSAGDPDIPDHITLWGLRLKICQGFDQYANVRPTRILPGIDAPLKRCKPEDLNWVIVRENSEGEYSGVGGRVHQGHPIEAATDVSIMTRTGVERRYPSMFEPIHGSAFDIMGKGLANPIGTFWSVVMLLEHLGENEAARRVMNAVEEVTANPGASHRRSWRNGKDRGRHEGDLRKPRLACRERPLRCASRRWNNE